MPEDRPPFILERAHGVAPGVDGKKADESFQMNQPRRQTRSASAPPVVSTVKRVATAEDAKGVPPHQLVLADLKEQKKLLEAAIAAIEALYH